MPSDDEYAALRTDYIVAVNRIRRLEAQLADTTAELDNLRENLTVKWGYLVKGSGTSRPPAWRSCPDEIIARGLAAEAGGVPAYRFWTPPTVAEF